MKIRFWGVRGSVASPLANRELRGKFIKLLKEYQERGYPKDIEDFINAPMRWHQFLTFGGNTSCVEVKHGDDRVVLDMGTGLREFGNHLFREMMEKKGLAITFLLSHVHWDHIQGLPFFGPLYINKETDILNSWSFYGGTNWQQSSEECMRGQMDPPNFPISWHEIERTTHKLHFEDVYDRRTFTVGRLKISCRKLNHPQETYGWRLESLDTGKVLTYTTDNEPYDPAHPDPRLLELAHEADIWITDCQYSQEVYNGHIGGVPRHGWGHSYPEAVAQAALTARVKAVVNFHHDPSATDENIDAMALETQTLIRKAGNKSTIVIPAYEGLELEV